jgi:hypothetical protein
LAVLVTTTGGKLNQGLLVDHRCLLLVDVLEFSIV